MSASSRSALRLALRSLALQGSWNYRTFQGVGAAWVLGDGKGEPRRPELFNTHPYLAPIALGALLRAESDGADPADLARLREGLGASLGALGDRLLWGVWRPICLVGALVAWALGVPPLGVAFGFLVVYNAVHLPLRVRGAAIGLEGGTGVAAGIRALDLPVWAERGARLGVLLVGVALGVALVHAAGLPARGLPLLLGAGAALLAGILGGEPVRRAGGAVLLAIVVGAVALGGVAGGLGGP